MSEESGEEKMMRECIEDGEEGRSGGGDAGGEGKGGGKGGGRIREGRMCG